MLSRNPKEDDGPDQIKELFMTEDTEADVYEEVS